MAEDVAAEDRGDRSPCSRRRDTSRTGARRSRAPRSRAREGTHRPSRGTSVDLGLGLALGVEQREPRQHLPHALVSVQPRDQQQEQDLNQDQNQQQDSTIQDDTQSDTDMRQKPTTEPEKMQEPDQDQTQRGVTDSESKSTTQEQDQEGLPATAGELPLLGLIGLLSLTTAVTMRFARAKR